MYITFPTVAQWNVYGVSGALDWRRFVRSERIPGDFPYTAMTYTGYGGVLLVCDVLGNPLAYDLSCPVECSQNVRVEISTSDNVAVCPKCGSKYNVFSLYGHPVSGPAADRGYGLTRYKVVPGREGTYLQITN